ncbi:hypothetical protein FEM48_Zijuj02G0181300 [Ziziphus jujuba var. spinosa]|uniref:Subtilisin-like protease SBT1.9 n=1 Tax=Ziziphus jujuba var. spinosa TaxID=714518 RepID=A0A978VX68_ZIZJJ|nr:hypothetical protein FEM48_Zijuj02G0181300 [Ziziphus jujuba var. spinosa]
MPKAFTNHHHWYSSIFYSLSSAKSSSSSLDEQKNFSPYLVYSYDNALHGFSASLTLDELEELKKSLRFISSYIDHAATLDTTHTYKFLSLNPSQGLCPASNYGEHVIVGVIDNGVWPKSESFQDNGMARGIIPHSRLAAYKVFRGEGSQTSDVLAGMDQAIEDGVDVISISIGNDGVPLYEDPVAIASFTTMEKGVFVLSSAGNAIPDPHTLHNGIPWTLTVAASTIDRSFGRSLIFRDNFTITSWTMFPGNAVVEKAPLYYNKTISRFDSAKNLSRVHTASSCARI